MHKHCSKKSSAGWRISGTDGSICTEDSISTVPEGASRE